MNVADRRANPVFIKTAELMDPRFTYLLGNEGVYVIERVEGDTNDKSLETLETVGERLSRPFGSGLTYIIVSSEVYRNHINKQKEKGKFSSSH